MDVYVSVPDADEDLSLLLERLKKLYKVAVQITTNHIRITGSPEEIFLAQNCALRFIGPESMLAIHVDLEFLSLFFSPSLIQHFEDMYQVFFLVKRPQGLLIKGSDRATKHVHKIIKDLENNCLTCKSAMDQFKLNNLRLLCYKFRVQFSELPDKDSLRVALLGYFCSLLDPGSNKLPQMVASSQPPFVEAYRKDPGKDCGK
ncbi:unnamed protein product [Echinostoma caproni]|uniref:Nuclear receptor domain-containing protein n=1 Tax=Echinostoma caproni TaxID=27848 RepID=A0A183BBB9_9TREM|nr:unnamed protein product [Echinostoma caproni]